MADNTAEIAAIDKILSQGASIVEVDGQKVKYDLAALSRRRAALAASDDTQKRRRPAASNIYLGGF